MNRRGFLGFLGAAIAGATLDPERLLWEPGKKLISIPPIVTTCDDLAVRAYVELCYKSAAIEFGNYMDAMVLNDEHWRGDYYKIQGNAGFGA